MMMTTIGEPHRSNPTWDFDHPSAHNIYANGHLEACQYESDMSALLRYLPSKKYDGVEGVDEVSDDFEFPVDAFSCDDFRMFEFKVRKCLRARSHDWTECPFAHPGEKARRRDPRKCHYSGSPCADFRKGACQRGDACEYAHGVFECWLHPARYRTQPCKDGTRCRRRVCFFAHTPEQLRTLPHATSPDTSPSVLSGDSFVALGLFGSSPKSSSYSPPVSPKTLSPPLARGGLMSIKSVDQLAESMRRRLQVNEMKMGMGLGMSPPSWGVEFGSPRSPKLIRPVFTTSLPSTPIGSRALEHARLGTFDVWETYCQEEPLMEYPQCRVGLVDFSDVDPDVGWVSELIE